MRTFIPILIVAFLLTGCTDHFAERARYKPLRIAALAGDMSALSRLEAEAQRGAPEAQNQLGRYLFEKSIDGDDSMTGTATSEDAHIWHDAALKWWRKAAKQGNAPAAYNLGLVYDIGVTVNLPEAEAHLEAVKWYRQAAERGDRESAYKLWFLVWRDGVNFKYQPKSQSPAIPPPKTAIYEEESAKWLRRAAEQGHRESQFWMASQINKNPQEAYFWALLLHTRDKEYAEKVVDVTLRNIDRIKSMLTPEQIAETEERVKKWKPAPVLWPQPDTSE